MNSNPVTPNEIADYILKECHEKGKIIFYHHNADSYNEFKGRLDFKKSFKLAIEDLEYHNFITARSSVTRVAKDLDITTEGRQMIQKHGSFTDYLKDLDKEEQTERANRKEDRAISRSNLRVAIISIVVSSTFGIWGIYNQVENNKLQLEVESLQMENDTLRSFMQQEIQTVEP